MLALLAFSTQAQDASIVRMTCHFDSPEGPKELTLSIDTISRTVDTTPPSAVRIEDSLYTWTAGSMTFVINRYTGKFTFGPTDHPELMAGACDRAVQKL
ncbi:hypothetical protein [Dyella japonica]|uniref:hypothetical protein n=1 Tax=Dyella japonica TaxID=231455 RepID=UPI0012E009DF|nr:hypothetical protein [Dyella japonica]